MFYSVKKNPVLYPYSIHTGLVEIFAEKTKYLMSNFLIVYYFQSFNYYLVCLHANGTTTLDFYLLRYFLANNNCYFALLFNCFTLRKRNSFSYSFPRVQRIFFGQPVTFRALRRVLTTKTL